MSSSEDRRLSGKARPQAAPIAFEFEGSPIAALPGESLAAALAATGEIALRQAGAHERRGVYCGMGVCQECLVEIDGRGGQRACMTAVAAGMKVRRHDPERALLAPLGVRPESDPPVEEVEVVIVGAGPAGLAAAIVLAEGGLRPVVLDERSQPGGQYFKPLAPSHAFAPGGEDRQFAAGRETVARARAAGVVIRNGWSVWQGNVDPDGRVSLGVLADGQNRLVLARAALLATGEPTNGR